MNIGKTKRVHTDVPGSVPVVIPKVKPQPRQKPAEKPIHVPNWPTKKPEPAKVYGKP
jgi:hypothetical protein